MERIGLGYDSHRFADGRPLVLGGVAIQYDQGLAGHSDADVLLHAVTDALLGAVGAGDIGDLFPDTDPQWAGADSGGFVRHAMGIIKQAGYRVANCDTVIIAEQPKLTPYKDQMRAALGQLLDVDASAVSVKAKTSDRMGAIGRGEGIAAMALILLTQD